jgi:ribose 5-phosphate isomerase A
MQKDTDDMSIDINEFKRQAAEHAASFVQSGMVLGLGTGSTATYAVKRIGERLRDGDLKDIVGVPTSYRIERVALEVGIPLVSLDAYPALDLTIDGADEIDPQFNVIKGGGGALLREKIVAQATRRQIIIANDAKLSDRLGTLFHVPVEVISFGWVGQQLYLESLGGHPSLRVTSDDKPFVTDHGNYIIDCHFGPIDDVPSLAQQIKQRTGIVEHGLFVGLVHEVIVAGQNGIQHLTRS